MASSDANNNFYWSPFYDCSKPLIYAFVFYAHIIKPAKDHSKIAPEEKKERMAIRGERKTESGINDGSGLSHIQVSIKSSGSEGE